MDGVVQTEPPEVSDRELVASCQTGDEEAFDALIRRHQQRAFNVAYQLLRDREDATEVAQDAFVRIYRSVKEFRGECEFTTWLHQIVVNLAHNRHRWWQRRGRAQTVSLDAPLETGDGTVEWQLPATGGGPDAEAAKAEFVRKLGAKMAELPAAFREVLVLRNVENLGYEEIAVVLKCSIGTVKSRIARAREALRESLKHE
jgi:RNA polymerase sigma-70 factor (ECF subfamily)